MTIVTINEIEDVYEVHGGGHSVLRGTFAECNGYIAYCRMKEDT